ncbi:MAG: CDP-glycerol glycerophosphotransferase family protein [Microcella sp.]|uniref:CDP-glycerol glycerophosphotransferase family protein n=1 Tax=Microcella sp. TaxID=1913979 RepID=UPI00331466A5
MARFTFSAGNARVLARAPLYALGALAGVLVPRSPRQWVLGSGTGLGEGALALHDLAREREPECRLTWLASSSAELQAARARGMRALPKRGLRGLWATLRAGVAVVTHGFGDVNRFGVSGARVVQLWHGIPLKRLHLDSASVLRLPLVGSLPGVGRLMRVLYRRAGAQIALFPVASALVAGRIRSAFGLDASRILVSGDPRDDVLLRGTAEARRRRARAAISDAVGALPDAGPVVLYAPTWRDGDKDAAIPSADEWQAITAWADRAGAVLLIRSHPLGAGSYAAGAERSARIRLLGRDLLADVTPVLPGVDAVVTDYSSIAFDAAIAGVPTVFFAPDLARYLATRGLYTPYREFSGGEPATTWAEAIERVDDALGEGRPAALAHAAWLRDEHVDLLDGRATERVLDAVLALLGERTTVPPSPASSSGHRIVIEEAAFVDDDGVPSVRVRGRASVRMLELSLTGPRLTLQGRLEQHGDEFTATVPLLGERWGAAGLPPRSGDYRLESVLEGSPRTARAAVRAEPGRPLESVLLHARLVAQDGSLLLRVEPPLADDERGASGQRRLERAYRRRTANPERAVFFESFYSQTAACNPLAIDRELARVRPDVTRYWSVVDRSIAVPEGAVPIVEGSAEWWQVRADARLLVVNDWLRKRWKRRSHQTVLQTWHGTMLKRLALDRDGVGLRTRIAVRRESARWQLLLAQNEYAAGILRRAYAYRGPLWVEGYPRSDTFVAGDREAVRARLGLRAQQRAVLYAPTWRDDRTELVDYLDLPSFAAELRQRDPHAVLVVRGHSRTLRFGRDLEGPGVVDATTYPDVADLLLAADVVVTDYSSIMFDLAATDTPVILFTPDLDRYADELRGFYFDVTADSPGPIVSSRDALLDAIAVAGSAPLPPQRAAWRERFTPHDDGRAGERVVARILAEGLLD